MSVSPIITIIVIGSPGQALALINTTLTSLDQAGSIIIEIWLAWLGESSEEFLDLQDRFQRVNTYPEGGIQAVIRESFQKAQTPFLIFLFAGDQVVPGRLDEATQSLIRSPQSSVAIGRTWLLDSDGQVSGILHPGKYTNHQRLLQIWVNPAPPLPACVLRVSSAKKYTQSNGHLPSAWFPYELLVTITRDGPAVIIDHPIVACRLISGDPILSSPEEKRLAIQFSRFQWEPWYSPKTWKLWISLAKYTFDCTGRAYRQLEIAQGNWQIRKWAKSFWHTLLAILIGPDVVLNINIFPWFRDRILRKVLRFFSL